MHVAFGLNHKRIDRMILSRNLRAECGSQLRGEILIRDKLTDDISTLLDQIKAAGKLDLIGENKELKVLSEAFYKIEFWDVWRGDEIASHANCRFGICENNLFHSDADSFCRLSLHRGNLLENLDPWDHFLVSRVPIV